jgi:hypothetical protein
MATYIEDASANVAPPAKVEGYADAINADVVVDEVLFVYARFTPPPAVTA